MTEYSVIIPKSENEGYGIRIVSTRLVYDISRKLSAVNRLCQLCNELDVDPAHFDTVLEDFLSQNNY